ncbi:MAG: DUF6261 family protein [Bacteroidota bacterium]
MTILSLPQLRLAELQSLTESLLPIATPLTEVGPQTQQVSEAFETFKQGMIKNAAASDKKTLDKTRDQLTSGLLYGVQSELLFPPTGTETKTLEQVAEITGRYGFGLNRLPYNEQTAETDNMLKELEALNLSSLPNISRWTGPIREANEAFKAASTDFLEGKVEAADTASATEAAPALETAIRELFTLLFAHLQISKTETLEKAYKELAALVDSYK